MYILFPRWGNLFPGSVYILLEADGVKYSYNMKKTIVKPNVVWVSFGEKRKSGIEN